jgi:Sperm tail C-terminal domain
LSKSGIKPESAQEMDAAILRSLGLTTEEDAARLVEHFVEEKKRGGEEESENTKGNGKGNVTLIPHAQVMDALTAFIKSRNEMREKEDGGEEPEVRFGETTAMGARSGTAASTERGLGYGGMNEDVVKEYWERIAGVIPDSVVSVWDRLEREMTKYNQILKDRMNLLQGNEALKTQNDELKTLLNHYLSAKINEELIVPPVAIPPQQQQQQQQQRVTQGSRTNSARQ